MNRISLTATAAATLVLLAGCGGGGGGATASGPTPAAALAVADAQALPTYHLAPVLLAEPPDTDADGASASAGQNPMQQGLSAALAAVDTARLLPSDLGNGGRESALALKPGVASAQPTVLTVYSPAQIRAAYGLPAAPAPNAVLTATQAAAFGAGQTIYVVDAQNDPKVAAELAAFNTKFGLPACATVAIAPTARLPLAAPGAGCSFSVVYATAAAAMTSTAPAYNQGWATEIALDVQWAHAIAPLARIVLVEAPDASSTSLGGAIRLANAMGSGVVTMSFGAREGSWTGSVDSWFTGAGMTYAAATGDGAAGVNWPSSSAHVLAVGGTTLAWSGSGTRSESTWSGTGGGISAYTARASWQSAVTVASGAGGAKQALKMRGIGDVAFNADPYSGQYVAVIAPSATAASWLSVGGTSLATPQWAGLIAVANAQRALVRKAVLGDAHTLLYTSIGAVPGLYVGAFHDVTTGADGSCATCKATTGYDLPTGLGTPNAANLLTLLASS